MFIESFINLSSATIAWIGSMSCGIALMVMVFMSTKAKPIMWFGTLTWVVAVMIATIFIQEMVSTGQWTSVLLRIVFNQYVAYATFIYYFVVMIVCALSKKALESYIVHTAHYGYRFK